MCFDSVMIDRTLVLESARVRLEPLSARHLPSLRERCADPALWEFVFGENPFGSEREAQQWLDDALADPSHVPFAVVDRATGEVIGSTRYADIAPEHWKLEIGWTFFARAYWRTHVNRECKLLMLRHAFERWNALRVQLKAEGRNMRSREAMLAWGATYEGTMRNFRVRPSDGSIRDVAFYSVIDREWPQVRERLERLLAARTESAISA